MNLLCRFMRFWLPFWVVSFSALFIYFLLKVTVWEQSFDLWEIIIAAALCISFLAFVFVWIYQQTWRQRTVVEWIDPADLKILKRIVDVQENVLIAFDKEFNVFWTNNSSFFAEFYKMKRFAGKPLNKFFPLLLIKKIKNSELITDHSLLIKNKSTGVNEHFRISLIKDSVLLLHNEQLNFALKNRIKENQLVFFLLQIDFEENTDNTLDNLLETKRSQVLVNVELQLRDVLANYQPWISSSKENLFAVLLHSFYFQQLKKTDFQFFEKLKTNILKEFKIKFTFSAGVCEPRKNIFSNIKNYDFYSCPIGEMYNSSIRALDMAIARGGDQIVLTKFNDDTFEVFGRQKEKLSSVDKDLNKNYQLFVSKLERYKNIFIFGHRQADLDVFGAGIGLKFLLDNLFPKKATTFITSKPEPKTVQLIRKMFNSEERTKYLCNLKTADQKLFRQKRTAFIVVDTNQIKKVDLAPRYRKLLIDNVFIIDHHLQGLSFADPTFKLINTSFSSASEIITHFLDIWTEEKEETKTTFSFPTNIAEALLMGILIDTNNLQNNLGNQTFSAVDFLTKKGAQVNELQQRINRMKLENLPTPDEVITVQPNQVVLRVFDRYPSQERASVLAEEYLVKQAVDVVFVVLFNNDKKVFVSGRSSSDFNVEVICKMLGGGGDRRRGAAQLSKANPNETIDKIVAKIQNAANT